MIKKFKKTAKNPIKVHDNKCFQYAAAVALNHKEIRKTSKGISKIEPFMGKCNLKGIDYSSEKDDWKKFEHLKTQLRA